MWGEYRTAIPTNLMAIFRLSSGKHFGITCAKRHIFQTLSETRKQTRAELHSVTRLSKAHIFRHRAAVKSACQRSDATVAGLCLAKHPTGPTPLTSAVSRLEQCAIDFEHGFRTCLEAASQANAFTKTSANCRESCKEPRSP